MSPFLTTLSTVIAKNHKKLLFACVTLIMIMIPGLGQLKTDFGIRVWLEEDDPLVHELNKFETDFGNDESVVVVIHDAEGVFKPNIVKLIQNLTKKLSKLSEIEVVDSLSNYNWITGSDDAVDIDPFLRNKLQLTPELLQKKQDQALGHEIIPGYLLSRDGKSTYIFAHLPDTLNHAPDYKIVMQQVQAVVENTDLPPGVNIYLTGAGALNDAFREVAEKDKLSK